MNKLWICASSKPAYNNFFSPDFIKDLFFIVSRVHHHSWPFVTKKDNARTQAALPFLGGGEKQNGDVLGFEERGIFWRKNVTD